MLNKLIKYFLENKLVTFLLLILFIVMGIINAPFNWDGGILPRDPVPVDAIPDIGENQQIVYTEWPGRSPRDIEDQISYPLTTALLGIPGVKTMRSNSIFGLSSIYIIFEENIEFYWSRARILEKLNSLPTGILPDGVTPALGPDATALGQIYWYTLEGRDKHGNPAGGWDPQELRSLQDFYVRYALTSVKGVAEVASIGGFVKEYQVDIDPNAMKAFGVTVAQVIQAVKKSNLDIGARTIEFNRVEYLVRALGYIKKIEDLEESVVAVNDNVPVRIKDIARVNFGPATRRGGLDKDGAEAVGGIVVARYGSNPLEVINRVKAKIAEITTGLPRKILDDGTVSRVTIIPFYDRTGLIKETLGTLESALNQEILITIIVVIILIINLRASLLISSLLPVGVLMTFIIMRRFGVDANIVALSGIAIAIGVMVDIGVVFTENIIRHLRILPGERQVQGTDEVNKKNLAAVIYRAATEVAPAVITALSTTVVSFLPVFAMQSAEGKLFKPLAFTKTFAMISALVIGLAFIPAFAHVLFSIKFDKKKIRKTGSIILIISGVLSMAISQVWLAFVLVACGIHYLLESKWPDSRKYPVNIIYIVLTLSVVLYYLTSGWMPLGAQNSTFINFLFVMVIIGAILGIMTAANHFYPVMLKWCLENKWKFLSIPVLIVFLGVLIWQGANKIFSFLPDKLLRSSVWQPVSNIFPGTGKEFMPTLDEGSFLLMPTSMPHSGVEENLEVIAMLDIKVNNIPEVESTVGKWGRVNSALDPAPVSMYENLINYKPEYILDENGHRMKFKVEEKGLFVLNYPLQKGDLEKGVDENNVDLSKGIRYDNQTKRIKLFSSGKWENAVLYLNNTIFRHISLYYADYLIKNKNGENFRNWRKYIKSPDDIWREIVNASKIPGLTSAPKLQPIQTRLIMLQTGMRAPMGIKVYGPDLKTIEETGYTLEKFLKEVPVIESRSVFADRVVGKPYLEIKINRKAIGRYGLTIDDMQMVVGTAIGGMKLTTTVEGRERFPVRMRYARELRDNPEGLKKVLIPTPSGVQVPLSELAEIAYSRGPQLIKGEDTFLTGYVIFDKKPQYAEGDVVEEAQKYLKQKVATGEMAIPAGVSYKFTGDYENQIRASKRLVIVVPVSLIIIFLILYFQFRSVTTSSFVFSGIFVAFAGGFLMIWLYGQDWFMNFTLAGINMRDLFRMHTINLSVAVWIGFVALFGVATDNGVIMGTYLMQVFDKNKPVTIEGVRASVLAAGMKRIRPAMMTAATTIIALIPVLTSTGKGADIMVPMAIPSFGGMIIQLLTVFMVPVFYSLWQERKINKVK
jgi:Cu(I)/Ag(I) efflux system membrane protein CusA/SilA